jgi:hypothetical protein
VVDGGALIDGVSVVLKFRRNAVSRQNHRQCEITSRGARRARARSAPENQLACSAKCRAAMSRGRRQQALDERYERLAELLRLALRIVEDR